MQRPCFNIQLIVFQFGDAISPEQLNNYPGQQFFHFVLKLELIIFFFRRREHETITLDTNRVAVDGQVSCLDQAHDRVLIATITAGSR